MLVTCFHSLPFFIFESESHVDTAYFSISVVNSNCVSLSVTVQPEQQYLFGGPSGVCLLSDVPFA